MTKNIKETEHKLYNIIRTANRVDQDLHRAKGEDKVGNLRGGNCGCIYIDEHEKVKYLGECPRKCLLRTMGIEYTPVDKKMLFNSGYDIERGLAQRLKNAAEQLEFTVLREEEVPVVVKTENNRLITGSPDFGFFNKNTDELEFGAEMKGVFSNFTAEKLWFKDSPATSNLCQSGLYSGSLGVPWILYYLNPNSMDASEFTKMDKSNWVGGKKPFFLKVPPFERFYHLSFLDDNLYFRNVLKQEKTLTKISYSGIMNFYNLVDSMIETRDIGPRMNFVKEYAINPATNKKKLMVTDGSFIEWDGSFVQFDKCDKRYCDFSEVCAEVNTFDDFIGECSYIVNQKEKF